MELAEILNYVLGGTSILGLVGMIIYRKQNKSLKDSEAKQAANAAKVSDVEVKTAEIDYSNKYFNDMLSLLDTVKQLQEQAATKQDTGNENQRIMMADIKDLKKTTDNLSRQNLRQDGLLTDIVAFLNGDFQNFQKTNHPNKDEEIEDQP